MARDLSHLADEACCSLTTIGRVSGRPHTIEIWFALKGSTLYLLSGKMDQANWVKNAWHQPEVRVSIREMVLTGHARPVSDPSEDALVRQLIENKYHEAEEDLDAWLKSALPVAVDLVG